MQRLEAGVEELDLVAGRVRTVNFEADLFQRILEHVFVGETELAFCQVPVRIQFDKKRRVFAIDRLDAPVKAVLL